MENQNLKSLYEAGQAIWYDNISRDELEKGVLSELVSQGVTGLTSNPSIFKKAIADTDIYDSAISELSSKGLSGEQATLALMIQDVARAAELLFPVYQNSKAQDGYASIEVSPLLAEDTTSTISEAEKIWSELGAQNIMVKVPATTAGLPAIEEILKKGINVNVTLIFSLDSYKAVLERFMSACEWRVSQGLKIDTLASVASFFVSRLDVLFEREMGELNPENIGKIGIANSLLAYEHFESVMGSDRALKLLEAGMMKQRPLWASTSAKNEGLSETHYITKLLKPNTVNTLPPKTLDAVLKSDEDMVDTSYDLAKRDSILDSAASAGFKLEKSCEVLLEEGVESFSSAYKDLVDSVSKRLT